MKHFTFLTLFSVLLCNEIVFGNQSVNMQLNPITASQFSHSLQLPEGLRFNFKSYVICTTEPATISRRCANLVIDTKSENILENSNSIVAEYCKQPSKFRKLNPDGSKRTSRFLLDFAVALQIPKMELDGLLLTCRHKDVNCKDSFCEYTCSISHILNKVSCN